MDVKRLWKDDGVCCGNVLEAFVCTVVEHAPLDHEVMG